MIYAPDGMKSDASRNRAWCMEIYVAPGPDQSGWGFYVRKLFASEEECHAECNRLVAAGLNDVWIGMISPSTLNRHAENKRRSKTTSQPEHTNIPSDKGRSLYYEDNLPFMSHSGEPYYLRDQQQSIYDHAF